MRSRLHDHGAIPLRSSAQGNAAAVKHGTRRIGHDRRVTDEHAAHVEDCVGPDPDVAAPEVAIVDDIDGSGGRDDVAQNGHGPLPGQAHCRFGVGNDAGTMVEQDTCRCRHGIVPRGEVGILPEREADGLAQAVGQNSYGCKVAHDGAGRRCGCGRQEARLT